MDHREQHIHWCQETFPLKDRGRSIAQIDGYVFFVTLPQYESRERERRF
ncbi:hypothetical protein RMSM_07487 [Rhodopirellula maiorica SM1]|uniref:Uncharacterized protein n=1 Tax=Rhodopirellula maiorica SM1 TaxID=1265738 RepID=M5R859_9BACT|nr:hypothetical protein RMSM_07487 [Rhodopirellula maiorica SM1]